MKIDFLLVTHRIYFDGKTKVGGLDRTKEYLLARGYTVGLIENPLTTFGKDLAGGCISRVSVLEKNKTTLLNEFSVFPSSEPLRWVSEYIATVTKAIRFFDAGYTCFAGDPLSSSYCIALKFLGRSGCAVMHCTDFADRRFQNYLLNGLYLGMYKMAVKYNDFVLCITRRMSARFAQWNPRRAYTYFPNTPDMTNLPFVRVENRKRTGLVLMGPNEQGMDHGMLARSVARLKERFLDIDVLVLGSGKALSMVMDSADKCGVGGLYNTPGYIDRENALQMVAGRGIGVVLYNGSDSYNYYRDSLKIREYAACGLPSISDGSTETALDSQKAGACICVKTEDEFVSAFELLQHEDIYRKMSVCAFDWAMANDKRKYLDDLHNAIADKMHKKEHK